MNNQTVNDILNQWEAFTQLSDNLIHVYNIAYCPECGDELMSKENEYIELNPTAAGALVSLLRFHRMGEYEDTPEEIEWLGDLPMQTCENCEANKSLAHA